MAPIDFQLAAKPDTWKTDTWDNIDHLAQIEVDDGGIKHFYYLYWHRQASMVLLRVESRNQYYWSCGGQTLNDLFRYFQGFEREFKMTDVWASRDTPDNKLLDQPMNDIKNQHWIVSITCAAA